MIDHDLAAEVIALLNRRGQTLATAESLTGGLIGAALTAVPGASRAYRGGVISYATDLKVTLAGVAPATLETVGPVAGSTAEEMARGVADRCSSDYALAVTGVAGPDAQDGHPVGQLFIAVVGPAGAAVTEHRLSGDRKAIRAETVRRALRAVLEQLGEESFS